MTYMSEKNHGKMAAFVTGAATAVAAGGYFLFGPNGRYNREKSARWIEATKKKVLARMRVLKDVGEDAYEQILDDVIEDYTKAKKLTLKQGARLKAHLLSRWEEMRELAKQSAEEAWREIDEEDK